MVRTEKEIFRVVNISNMEILSSYLMEKYKHSTGSYYNNKSILKHFLNYIKKPIDEITVFDIMEYFEDSLNKEKIKKTTKNTRRYTLKAFFNYVRKQKIKEGIEYTNPVPDKDLFEFSNLEQDIIRQSDQHLPVLSIEQINQILEYFNSLDPMKEKDYRNYILFLLVLVTGARISEIRTLRLRDLNIEQRFLESGFIKDARKTTLRSEKSLLFFFPRQLKKILIKYIIKYKDKSEFLFYSPRNPEAPLSHILAMNIAKRISKKSKLDFTWHYLRKTLITERIKMGCPEGLSEGLSNHIGTSVEWESYIKLSIPERRDKYDEYFPYKKIFIEGGDKKDESKNI